MTCPHQLAHAARVISALAPHNHHTTCERVARAATRVLVGVLLLASSQAALGMEVPLSGQQLADLSSLVLTGQVVGRSTRWADDQRGRHIYTDVTIRPTRVLFGQDPVNDITLEIVGGTVGHHRDLERRCGVPGR